MLLLTCCLHGYLEARWSGTWNALTRSFFSVFFFVALQSKCWSGIWVMRLKGISLASIAAKENLCHNWTACFCCLNLRSNMAYHNNFYFKCCWLLLQCLLAISFSTVIPILTYFCTNWFPLLVLSNTNCRFTVA